MLTGLLMATLAAATALAGPGELPSPGDPPSQALRLVLLETLPSLLGAAAIGCYLLAFLGLPAPAATRPPWSRALAVVAGLAWGVDAAVGLCWLVHFDPATPDEAALLSPGVLLSAVRLATTG